MPMLTSEDEMLLLSCVAIVLLIDGLAYVATTTALDGALLPELIHQDLNAMLNSFEATANRG